jgi:hypothetical protein
MKKRHAFRYTASEHSKMQEMDSVKTEVICTHGSLLSAPSSEEGALSRLPTANTHVRKGHAGAPPRKIPDRQSGIEQTL